MTSGRARRYALVAGLLGVAGLCWAIDLMPGEVRVLSAPHSPTIVTLQAVPGAIIEDRTVGAHPTTGAHGEVADGAVRLPDGTLAGSALSLDRAFRRLLEHGGSLVDAAAAVSTRPAGLLGLPTGIGPGRPAHLTVVDDGNEVARTVVGGEEVFAG